MPRRPAKPCKDRICKNTVRDNDYCPDHAAMNSTNKGSGWSRSQGNKSRHQRGYGSAWDKLRKAILERDGYLCQPCNRVGLIISANIVDHKKNKKSGGTDDPSNLEATCAKCHRAKTQQEAKRAQHGTR